MKLVIDPDAPRRRFPAWLGFALCVTLARIAYLAWLCPYELVADEAQYWDWSRRPDLSYYSKGPGVAWAIAASTRLFGDAEWAVRLPSALSALTAMVFLGLLARSMAHRIGVSAPHAPHAPHPSRAAMLAVLAFCLMPAYTVSAILMTIDMPYIACWAGGAWAAWTIHERGTSGRSTLGAWLALGAALGIGFLFKYTILLLVPGLLAWAWLERRTMARDRATPRRIVLGLVVFGAVVAPVFIWNARHGWPTAAHLLGHLGMAGGDTPTSGVRPHRYDPRWTLEFVGAQLGIVGPLLIAAFVAAKRAPRVVARFALACAVPIIVFYFGVSFVTDVEGNWPIAGYITMLLPPALMLARRDTAGGRLHGLWRWSIGYGLVAALGAHSLSLLERVPGLTDVIPYHRLSGQREFAGRLNAVIEGASERDGSRPLIIADAYTRAALMAYYLPGHPSVCSAASYLGGRKSSYDFFADTDLRRADFVGRDAVLIGSRPERWAAVFVFDRLEQHLSRPGARSDAYFGRNYRGPAERAPVPEPVP